MDRKEVRRDAMKEMTTLASVDKLSEVLAFLEGYLEERECPPKASMQLAVALEEMFVNVASYAYTGSSLPADEQTATITLEDTDIDGKPGVKVSIADRGTPYDPLAKEDPDTTLSAEERQIGGLGIFMVKKSMDRTDYIRNDDTNLFIMEKSF